MDELESITRIPSKFVPVPIAHGQTDVPHPEVKYLVAGKLVVTLHRNKDGFWESSDGTIFGLFEPGATTDHFDRCGVAPFALPMWPCFLKLNEGCRPHDYAYSSPVWQAFHTRSETDEYLRSLEAQQGYPVIGAIAKWLSRRFGSRFWENKKTND